MDTNEALKALREALFQYEAAEYADNATNEFDAHKVKAATAAMVAAAELDRMLTAGEPLPDEWRPKPKVVCACGRPFWNRAGFANHANRCPQEQARSAAFVKAVQDGGKR